MNIKETYTSKVKPFLYEKLLPSTRSAEAKICNLVTGAAQKYIPAEKLNSIKSKIGPLLSNISRALKPLKNFPVATRFFFYIAVPFFLFFSGDETEKIAEVEYYEDKALMEKITAEQKRLAEDMGAAYEKEAAEESAKSTAAVEAVEREQAERDKRVITKRREEAIKVHNSHNYLKEYFPELFESNNVEHIHNIKPFANGRVHQSSSFTGIVNLTQYVDGWKRGWEMADSSVVYNFPSGATTLIKMNGGNGPLKSEGFTEENIDYINAGGGALIYNLNLKEETLDYFEKKSSGESVSFKGRPIEIKNDIGIDSWFIPRFDIAASELSVMYDVGMIYLSLSDAAAYISGDDVMLNGIIRKEKEYEGSHEEKIKKLLMGIGLNQEEKYFLLNFLSSPLYGNYSFDFIYIINENFEIEGVLVSTRSGLPSELQHISSGELAYFTTVDFKDNSYSNLELDIFLDGSVWNGPNIDDFLELLNQYVDGQSNESKAYKDALEHAISLNREPLVEFLNNRELLINNAFGVGTGDKSLIERFDISFSNYSDKLKSLGYEGLNKNQLKHNDIDAGKEIYKNAISHLRKYNITNEYMVPVEDVEFITQSSIRNEHRSDSEFAVLQREKFTGFFIYDENSVPCLKYYDGGVDVGLKITSTSIKSETDDKIKWSLSFSQGEYRVIHSDEEIYLIEHDKRRTIIKVTWFDKPNDVKGSVAINYYSTPELSQHQVECDIRVKGQRFSLYHDKMGNPVLYCLLPPLDFFPEAPGGNGYELLDDNFAKAGRDAFDAIAILSESNLSINEIHARIGYERWEGYGNYKYIYPVIVSRDDTGKLMITDNSASEKKPPLPSDAKRLLESNKPLMELYDSLEVAHQLLKPYIVMSNELYYNPNKASENVSSLIINPTDIIEKYAK